MSVRLLALRNCFVQPNFAERRKWKFTLNSTFLLRFVQKSWLEMSRIFVSVMTVGVWMPHDVIGHCVLSLVRTNWGTKMCHKLEIPCYLCIRISLTDVKCRPNVERTSESYTKSHFHKFSLRRRTGYYRREDVFRISLDIVGVAVERWQQ